MNPLKLANPVTVIKGAVGLAGTAVGVVEALVRGTAHLVGSGLPRLDTVDHHVRDHDDAHSGVVSGDIASRAARERVDLPFEPQAPDEPPVDVVGEALARESALGVGDSLEGAGSAHEPRAASRAAEHGEAPLQQSEREEIDDEVTAALEGDLEGDLDDDLDGDLEGVEEHLSQPLLEPGAAKALAAETEMLGRAADPNKG